MRATSLLALIFLSTSFVSHQSIAAPASSPVSFGREFFRPRDFAQYGIQIDGHHTAKAIRRRDNPTTTTAKGNDTPTKAPTASTSAASTGAATNGTNPSSIYSDQPVPTGTLSTGAIAGLSVVAGIFVVGAIIFACVRKKKRDERTSAIVAKSAVAFEQQTHDYEKLEEPESLGTFTVVSTYTPNMDDELEIQPGDKVTVLVTYDDGWVQGVNETRDGAKGVFPRHCIDMDGKKTSTAYEKRSSSMNGFTSVNLN
ncbi:8271_t:CDS:2 [Paraglomus occultum]|uniref:8271_t:CDS:1 n=1 Tax=Paraglomus occultum TaxID=144539 RepID=A0A9N8WLF6_9GLOM|nr:8271_t:CDS:2 [Paraglomus occultum]